jgi:hypothetical protein
MTLNESYIQVLMTLNESFGECVLSFLQDKQQDLQSISSVVDAVVSTVRCRSLSQCLCLYLRPLHLFLSGGWSVFRAFRCPVSTPTSLAHKCTNFACAQVHARSHACTRTRASNHSKKKKHSRKYLSTHQRSNGQWKFSLPQIASQVGRQPREVFGELRRLEYVILCGVRMDIANSMYKGVCVCVCVRVCVCV